LYYNYFAVPATAPPTDAPTAAHCSDTAGPANDQIAPPRNGPKIEPMLLLSDAVTLSTDAISVNTQQQPYVRYKILIFSVL